jgi:signal transduction histidine kinase
LRQDGQRYAAGDSGSEPADLQANADALSRQFAQLHDGQPAERSQAVARELITEVNTHLLVTAESQLTARQDTLASPSLQHLSLAERVGLGLMLLGVCGAVAGLLTGFGVARSFHRSLVEISLPVRDIAGRLNEVVGPITISSNTDLSELDDSLRTLADKTAEVVQRLQNSQQQSIRHDQLAAVGQLAAGLAHELRNPLMSVKLIVQTAAERTDHSLRQRDFAVIEDEITRLEELLQAFLDFARPPQPKRQTVDIRNLIARAVEVVRPRAAQQQVQLHLEATEPVAIEADESQLRQLLLNLLINALDVLPSGGNVWLEVCAGPHASCREPTETVTDSGRVPASEAGQELEGPSVFIRISDDGPGFSGDVINEAFEPFVSTKDTGIGLGLSICSQIVESHGGRIAAGNRREGGAEVTIQLPQHPTPRGVDLDVAVPTAENTLPSSAD